MKEKDVSHFGGGKKEEERRRMKASCLRGCDHDVVFPFSRDMNNPNHMLFYCLQLRGRRERLLGFLS